MHFRKSSHQFVPFPDQTKFRLPLAALADEKTRAMLRQIFLDPKELDPSRRAARVTRELAARLAKLSEQLERAGHAPDVVAQFLMRCLFTMFSEDVNLIPKESFTGMLVRYATPEMREFLPDALNSLWRTMDTGGYSPDLTARLRRFNGKLFHDATALPLTSDQMELLLQSAKADWTEVEPAIFGTLLERALDPKERHSLGAHYTPRRYVERLVLPTVLEPLRREWAAAQAAAARRLDEGQPKDARAELVRFLTRLTSLKILDPACGSGNFLYVTLEHLKRLEGEVLTAINSYGQTGLLELGGGTTVSPHQLLGLELNPRAAAIADVVLRIGYLQWHLRTYGPSELREPLLDEYQNIRQQDAALQHGPPVPRLDAHGQPVTRWDGTTKLHPATGQLVPDETARTLVLDYPDPQPAEWPQADFIVGNPPFVGNKRMRDLLGDGYADALRKAYKGKVPDSADLVMYWWDNAAEALRSGKTERFGFITTNSLTQTFNRRVLQRHMEADGNPISLSFAIPDHPWVDAAAGAAVRVAMTVAQPGQMLGTLGIVASEIALVDDDAHEVILQEIEGVINSDLSIGADSTSSLALKANMGISSRGVIPLGMGFVVTPERATILGLGTVDGIENHIRPYRNGKDITARSRNVMIIDLLGLTENEVLSRFPIVYQHILEHVKPERDVNNDKTIRTNWWLHARGRVDFRPALANLTRYIATVYVAKHRFFTFVDASVIPDDGLVAIASDDAVVLGILSSRIHITWALASGGRMGVGNDPRYNNSRTFDPFPFPAATAEQQARIRELAEQLDAHRKRQQAQHPALTLTDLYNVVEKLRAGQPLTTAKEQTINQQGLASVVLSLHQQLDTAVAAAYGWPADLPDAEILTRLVRLNHERAQEEAAGHVRYLRPAYQAPDLQQSALALPAATATKTVEKAVNLRAWPEGLANQMNLLRNLVEQAGRPVSVADVSSQIRGAKAKTIAPLLETLASLSIVRELEQEGLYSL
ncbi:class I SAM-dependent DNA methyltransferase [Hymenobacter endophyticus]|uniref:site-specific DNA-methyltransferase (adenine-specific) n=1 Tax=Hymenobacter endophyticus TaxID=3076335 RepID=A0ABU3TL39_9BACT|nr:DNA methyltransferase [Hymenobacter endophyticus]MDU0372097.1 type IIL restriction-modification enzyme MmeI [Hymenobacter endophyticus]